MLSTTLRSLRREAADAFSGRFVEHRVELQRGAGHRIENRVNLSPSGPGLVGAPRRNVTVLIPVFNAYDELRACVDSVIRNTSVPVTLLLIDDASPDERVAPYLRRLSQRNSSIRVEVNDVNLGFVQTANRGFAMVPNDDVIILNSDTEVPPRWIQSMLDVAADPTVATVTTMSNNAGAFSAPMIGEYNDVGSSADPVGRAVAHHSNRIRPDVPTGHGFCMYLRRQVIDELEGFDAASFGRGYCEENDFCLRAGAAGWRNVVDDAAFVLHAGSGSFGDDKTDLLAEHRRRLDELHPDYNDKVREFLADERMGQVRSSIAGAIDAADTALPRVLYVLHAGGGGTPQTNQDLMSGVADRFEPFLLRSDGNELILTHGVSGVDIKRIGLATPISTIDFHSSEYGDVVRRLLVELSIELVHVRHLQGHTHDLPRIAHSLAIPVVTSLHDFYFVCPTVQLLDEADRFCGGTCTPGQGECRLDQKIEIPHLKHGYVAEWRRRSNDVLALSDALVTTSSSAAAIISENLPDTTPRLNVIEHGRDLVQTPSAAAAPHPDEPVRILLPGTIGVHKGAALIRDIVELDVDERLEFHLIGNLTRRIDIPRLIDHGPYEREQFAQLAAEIRPAATAVLSIWAETYSHTVTESWSVGVPVLGSNWGAVAERLRRHGGGWIVDTTSPERAYEQICAAFADVAGWEAQRERSTVTGLPSTNDMATAYVSLYTDVLDGRRHLRRMATES